MIFAVDAEGWFVLPQGKVRCALGRAGVKPAADKREGDLASPIGIWPIRRLLYRPDRASAPVTELPALPIAPDDGWCDAPDDPAYNRPVKLPYPASAERMWRDDYLYDLVLVLGHNDDPPLASHVQSGPRHRQRREELRPFRANSGPLSGQPRS